MYKLLILFIICSYPLAAGHQQGIDTVYYFQPGTGQANGQGPEYYPDNIFGLPDTNAAESVGSANPEEILSLGLNGKIIVGFKNYEIIDGPGPDFTIFENAFINPINNKVFCEPAKIAVSSDGINFIEFPFDSLTLDGCAGTKPVYGKADPFDSEQSGGNSFDLSDLGISKVTHIKITDITEMIINNPEHDYYDVTLSGFDLDAVVGLNLEPVSNGIAEQMSEKKKYSISSTISGIEIINNGNSRSNKIEIFDVSAKLIYTNTFDDYINIHREELCNTILFVRIYGSDNTFTAIVR